MHVPVHDLALRLDAENRRLSKQLDEMAKRWRAEVDARLAAEAANAALSAAFKKIVKRWRDELDDLLKSDKP